MAIDRTKVAAYIRWSTDDQGQGTTLEVQRDACVHFIQSQGWLFQDRLVFVDDGYSGGTLDRPALTELRRQVALGAVDGVVVMKLDRLSRSVIDTVNLVLREWEGKCFVRSAREPIDTTTPAGKMFFYMLVSYAEWERSVIRERTLSGKRKRAEQGKNAGQKYPFGYRRGEAGGWALDGQDGGTAGGFCEARAILTGPAAVVRRIYDRFLAGVGLPAIAGELNRACIRTPEGRQWRASHVGRILDNPNYAGTYVYGKQRVAGALPAIVSSAEWEQAQAIRRSRATGRSKARAGGYLLSALARCAACGATLAGSRGATRRYYVCTGRVRGQCDCGSLPAESLEAAVLAEVRATVLLPEAAHDRVQQELARQAAEAVRAAQRARGELGAVQRRRHRLEEDYLNGGLNADQLRGLSGRLATEACTVQERLAQAEAAQARAEAALAEAALNAAGTGGGDHDPWPRLTFEELRQLLREAVADLTVYRPKTGRGDARPDCGPVQIAWTPRLADSRNISAPVEILR